MSPILLILIFIASTIVGYKIIGNVPSLLHTPLMSGMNALSGVIVLGAVTATHLAHTNVAIFFGSVGIVLAIVNVFGGFAITNKMLKMVAGKKK